ncbi:class Ib ribonucleoside-diphosphate reductase assembly flavoprotein NrdI [Corynebacterium sp.]|uniref:class Ib ribonucleoside-diphosphate reductase assembly flavoprotein NrdI n=1 Tax=Corynebacterium sp. TaxID=1720 RepID=UPI002A90F53B|nr:class Ib ribonucleoside-diphosphate reductase assembly flavoprotein NrdI [Corynebacterium sp.]MDY5785817.1 class Ib ribonucleoside-diphosphate reductase assembly flavoprotein NrdI [Corynebacterium sp.]
MLIVYFSSATGNTKHFVDKVGFPAARIPLRVTEPELTVDEPYVLICPTYGGGASISHENSRPVPRQVVKFLNNEHNRALIRGVISSGNSNFGPDFCLAGDVISAKCNVPYLYRFELMGAEGDASHVREQLAANADRLGLIPPDPAVVEKLRARDQEMDQRAKQRLAQLRAAHRGQRTEKHTA